LQAIGFELGQIRLDLQLVDFNRRAENRRRGGHQQPGFEGLDKAVIEHEFLLFRVESTAGHASWMIRTELISDIRTPEAMKKFGYVPESDKRGE
jgi:hypothetical protein